MFYCPMVPGLEIFYCIVLVNARSTHDAMHVACCHLPNRLAKVDVISLITLPISTNYTIIYGGHGAIYAAKARNVTKRTKCNERKKAVTCQLKFNISF